MCFEMRENSSDDSDSEYQYTKINPDWWEAQKKNKFYDEEWPNLSSAKIAKSADNLPKPCVENIRRLIRSKTQTQTKEIRNGCEEGKQSVTHETIENVTIDLPNLARIIEDARRPQSEAHMPEPSILPIPPIQPQSKPPPQPAPSLQSANNIGPQYSSINQTPPPASLPSTHHFPMNITQMGAAHYMHPNIAQYVYPSVGTNSIPTQYVPNSPIMNGNHYWPTVAAHQYGAPPQIHGHAPSSSSSHFKPIQQSNTQQMQKRVDPRLLQKRVPRQNVPQPTQLIPIQNSPTVSRTRCEVPSERLNELTPVKRISLADYKKKNQSDHADVKTPSDCDITHEESVSNVEAEMDSKSSNNIKENSSGEPRFSPVLSESNPDSPTSLTPPPSVHQPDDVSGTDNVHLDNNNLTPSQDRPSECNCKSIKSESQQNGYESDKSTDSDSTVEFTWASYSKDLGLTDQHDTTVETATCKHMEETTEDKNESETNADEIENVLKEMDGEEENTDDEIYDQNEALEIETIFDDCQIRAESIVTEVGDYVNEQKEEEPKETEKTDEIRSVQANEAPSIQPSIDKHKKCVIILEDIRQNPLFDKYMKRVDEPVKQAKPVNIAQDFTPIEIPDSDEENADGDKNDVNDESDGVIEISSDSD